VKALKIEDDIHKILNESFFMSHPLLHHLVGRLMARAENDFEDFVKSFDENICNKH